MNYFSIQNYTTHSTLSGLMEIDKWVSRAKELDYTHLGITEKGNMSSWLDFQEECLEQDIEPLFGYEFVIYDSIDYKKRRNATYKGVVLLYVKDEVGLENLITLNNISNTVAEEDKEGGFYYSARMDIETIGKYSEGLACVVPNDTGAGFKLYDDSRYKDLKCLSELAAIFGEDFYVGLNFFDGDESTNSLLGFLENSGWNVIPTSNSHYPEEKHSHLYDIIRRVDHNKRNNLQNRDRDVKNGFLHSNEQFKTSVSTLDPLWEDKLTDGLFNLKESLNFRMKTDEVFMPRVDLIEGLKEDLMRFIGEGFKKKLCPQADYDVLLDLDQLEPYRDSLPFEHTNKGERSDILHPLSVYIDRLRHEFEVIEELGYLDYFYVVYDICLHVDKVGLERGFARGSAAGSLVSYLLNITKVDPVRHDLLFSRFLNKFRKELPDIDLDFSKAAREEVKSYIKEKYGEDCFCSIGTFDRLKIVSAIKNVAAAYDYGIPLNELDSDGTPAILHYDHFFLSNIMKSSHAPATSRGEKELQERRESSEKFEEFYQKHSNWINDVILPLQETITGVGVHASGYLITPKPLNQCIPVTHHKTGCISQWRDRNCENLGYPKFDFLNIEAISVVGYAKQLIREAGHEIPEIEGVSLFDLDALTVLVDNDTMGLFQLGSWSQRKYGAQLFLPEKRDYYLTELREKIFDLNVARAALVRTGPMMAHAHDYFAEILNGLREEEYAHKDLKPILSNTLGQLVYQEQMMRIAVAIGGLNEYEADFLRKACGKKKLKEMEKWEDRFKTGALDNGYDKEMIDDLWFKIVAFAEYSFNLSHSVAYVLLTYYQAYIKSRFPMEFWCGILKFASDDVKEDGNIFQVRCIAERGGIEFVFPNIHGFSEDFRPAGENKIYWPCRAIKGLGDKTMAELSKGGRNSFKDFDDFMDSINKRTIHKGVVNTLIRAGFFDPLGPPWEVAKMHKKWRDDNKKKGNDIPYDMSHEDVFRWYKIRNDVYNMQVVSWKEVSSFHKRITRFNPDQFAQVNDGDKVLIGGLIEKLKPSKTSKNEWYAKLTIVDHDERYSVNLWGGYWNNKQLDYDKARPREGQIIELVGKKDTWKPEPDRVYHSLSVADKNDYVKILWDSSNIDKE